jgi:hypothetical protein
MQSMSPQAASSSQPRMNRTVRHLASLQLLGCHYLTSWWDRSLDSDTCVPQLGNSRPSARFAPRLHTKSARRCILRRRRSVGRCWTWPSDAKKPVLSLHLIASGWHVAKEGERLRSDVQSGDAPCCGSDQATEVSLAFDLTDPVTHCGTARQ